MYCTFCLSAELTVRNLRETVETEVSAIYAWKQACFLLCQAYPASLMSALHRTISSSCLYIPLPAYYLVLGSWGQLGLPCGLGPASALGRPCGSGSQDWALSTLPLLPSGSHTALTKPRLCVTWDHQPKVLFCLPPPTPHHRDRDFCSYHFPSNSGFLPVFLQMISYTPPSGELIFIFALPREIMDLCLIPIDQWVSLSHVKLLLCRTEWSRGETGLSAWPMLPPITCFIVCHQSGLSSFFCPVPSFSHEHLIESSGKELASAYGLSLCQAPSILAHISEFTEMLAGFFLPGCMIATSFSSALWKGRESVCLSLEELTFLCSFIFLIAMQPQLSDKIRNLWFC